MVGASGQGADSLILAPSLLRRAGPLRLTGMGLLLRGLSAEGGTDWRRHEGRLQQIDGDEHPGAARRRAGPGGGRQRFHDRRVLPVGAGDGGFPVEPDTAADLQLDAGHHTPAGLGRAQADAAAAVRGDAPAEIEAEAHRRHPAELLMGEAEQIVGGERGLELGRAAGGGGQYVAEIGERGIGDQAQRGGQIHVGEQLAPGRVGQPGAEGESIGAGAEAAYRGLLARAEAVPLAEGVALGRVEENAFDSLIFLGLLDDRLDAFGQHVGGLIGFGGLCRVVELHDGDGRVVARGVVSFGSSELPALLGRTTAELREKFGEGYDRTVVHRDDLVVVRRRPSRA